MGDITRKRFSLHISEEKVLKSLLLVTYPHWIGRVLHKNTQSIENVNICAICMQVMIKSIITYYEYIATKY